MPKHFKAARLWSIVAAAVLVVGTVSALGHVGSEGALHQTTRYSTAI